MQGAKINRIRKAIPTINYSFAEKKF